jgi:hypothetical protein
MVKLSLHQAVETSMLWDVDSPKFTRKLAQSSQYGKL